MRHLFSLFAVIVLLMIVVQNVKADLTEQQLELLCVTKLKVAEWAFNHTHVSEQEAIDYWHTNFVGLARVYPSAFTHTTKIEGERIIRDVRRLKDKLVTEQQQMEFAAMETSWCIAYQH